MTMAPHSGHPPEGTGLCARCRHAGEVKNARGSTFIRCGLSDTDPRFPKYPRLPVHACTGFSPPPGPERHEGAL